MRIDNANRSFSRRTIAALYRRKHTSIDTDGVLTRGCLTAHFLIDNLGVVGHHRDSESLLVSWPIHREWPRVCAETLNHYLLESLDFYPPCK